MGFFLFLGLITLAFAIAGPILWLRRRRMQTVVARWAAENRLEVIRCQEKTFSPFTFTLGKSRSQSVVLVTVVDAQGNQKTCWLKLGDYVLGLLIDQVECKWVEQT